MRSCRRMRIVALGGFLLAGCVTTAERAASFGVQADATFQTADRRCKERASPWRFAYDLCMEDAGYLRVPDAQWYIP